MLAYFFVVLKKKKLNVAWWLQNQVLLNRIKSFLVDLLKDYDGKRVMIVGHKTTQYGLEHVILGKSLSELVDAPWEWQTGWTYKLESKHLIS